MKLIVITNPEDFPGEGDQINALFRQGMECLHVRKPAGSREAYVILIEQIDPKYRSRLVLHHHHELAERLGIKKLHFTETIRRQTEQTAFESLVRQGYSLSTSIHHIASAEGLETYFSYAFLAPVFDSISKQNHKSNFPPDFRINAKIRLPLIALGGITGDRAPEVASMGFAGAAVLGVLWSNPDSVSRTFDSLKKAFEHPSENINRDLETAIHI